MTTVKKGLNKGLDELGLTELLTDINNPVPQNLQPQDQTYRQLPVNVLQPGRYQPRKDMDFEALQELSNSIKAQGIIQPIVVRPISSNRYEIIAGERRWRASQLAGLETVPVISRDLSDNAAIAMSLIENIQREDLNVIEEAMALQRLGEEFDMTHEQIAETVGRSRSSVSNMLRLLALNPEVRQMVERGALEMGHARALLSLEGIMQTQAAKQVDEKGLSVRDTERLVQKLLNKPAAKNTTHHIDPDVQRLQDKLSDKLGATVTIAHQPTGKGKLTIKYNTLDELDGILEHMQ